MSRRLTRKVLRNSTVAIVGPGCLGQAMGKLLLEAGVEVRFVVARRLGQARRAVRFIGGGKVTSMDSPQMAEADAILITTSDAAVEQVAHKIALYRNDWSARAALHTCGSLSASVLEPFKQRGACVGSLHPYQTVPTPEAGVRNLVGCYWAVEGDRQAKALAKSWVKVLGGIAFEIAPEAKPLYHLSAFLVCPTVVTLMDRSRKLLREAGVPRRIAASMLERFVVQTARNFADLGARRALTGPVVRGDCETILAHMAQLRSSAPEVVPAYRELVRLMLELEGKALSSRASRPLGRRSHSGAACLDTFGGETIH